MTVGTADGIKFSAASRCATVTNSGGSGACGKGFREENTTLMEEEMFVGDVISQIAYDPGFDGMGGLSHSICRWGREERRDCKDEEGGVSFS